VEIGSVSEALSFGVAIPAYRNVEGLRRCLQSIRSVSPDLFRAVTVTDDSGDGSVRSALSSEFPHVNWVEHAQNTGFGHSANDAVRAASCEIVILLNDDVELLSDPLPKLRRAFLDKTLFAVTFQSQHEDGSFREGAKRLSWRSGLPKILHNAADQAPVTDGFGASAYAVGGHAAFHREKFLALGEFDSLFDPFYWEDVDLCVRARQRGWPTLYAPACAVKHAGPSAIRTTHDRDFICETTQRNRLLFAWRHLPRALRPVSAVALGFRIAAAAVSRDHVFLRAWRAARLRWNSHIHLSRQTHSDSPTTGANLGQN
jgi:GT2 family glycosyltransferase